MVSPVVRSRRRLLLAVASAATVAAGVPIVAGCGHQTARPAAPAAAQAVPGAGVDPIGQYTGPDTIMIIRHGEKPAGKNAPFGIDGTGNQSAGSLTVQGWARAGALAELFAPPHNEPIRPG